MVSKKHRHKFLLAGIFLGGVFLVGLVASLILVRRVQNLTPQAASRCYLAIRSSAQGQVGIIEGAGGIQDRQCVGGVGNTADRYGSYYGSRESGQADLSGKGDGRLGDENYPCKSTQASFNGKSYTIGGTCQVAGKVGSVLCVGGPEREYWGCLNNQGGNYYERLGEREVSYNYQPSGTPTPVAGKKCFLRKFISDQDIEVIQGTIVPWGDRYACVDGYGLHYDDFFSTAEETNPTDSPCYQRQIGCELGQQMGCVSGPNKIYQLCRHNSERHVSIQYSQFYRCPVGETFYGITYECRSDIPPFEPLPNGLRRAYFDCSPSYTGQCYRRWTDHNYCPENFMFKNQNNEYMSYFCSYDTVPDDSWDVRRSNKICPPNDMNTGLTGVCWELYFHDNKVPSLTPTPTQIATPTPTLPQYPTKTPTPTLTPLPPKECKNKFDLNCDGLVDLKDYNILIQNFDIF